VAHESNRYEREPGAGLSFERVAFFTDAVFAIAMTLIVVGIAVPAITDEARAGALWDALWHQRSEIISFFIGVLVIGFYWRSHHQFFDDLDAVDSAEVGLTVPYLAFVAFLPFPISLVGTYADNPVAWSAFALNLAAVSAMETVLLAHAQRGGLLSEPGTAAEQRWARWMSLSPVPVFVVSIGVAFVQPWLTPLVWALTPLVQATLTRRFRPTPTPATADR
jgi:uncharacterized membrane protein